MQVGVLCLAVLAAVRILVFLLRVAAGPGGGTRGTELFFGIVLWIGAALYLIGWLPAVDALLDGIAIDIGEVRISLLGVARFLIISSLLVLMALALSRYVGGRLSIGWKKYAPAIWWCGTEAEWIR